MQFNTVFFALLASVTSALSAIITGFDAWEAAQPSRSVTLEYPPRSNSLSLAGHTTLAPMVQAWFVLTVLDAQQHLQASTGKVLQFSKPHCLQARP
ncbi:hypothetical protein JR316_0010075 [Psilocybe cubensis]|uniref:Uncharacterized protein n=2 Tax=Psilocybe cubensis TaxID=181762 RepID=A0ACB8GQ32_PSICU|nr:hypothetical protein JR316_0010075 [Psilocybe cubensis]KAH9477843.1 hypothetical protein JR316_0010075 [Psilocybe cubensis]